jgi:hypothetical protein
MSELSPDDFADVVVTAIKAALAPIVARLKAAEDMIADLRAELRTKAAAPGVEWAGTWKRETTFRRGQLTTHRGGLWLARRSSTGTTPGDDGDAWVLAMRGC